MKQCSLDTRSEWKKVRRSASNGMRTARGMSGLRKNYCLERPGQWHYRRREGQKGGPAPSNEG